MMRCRQATVFLAGLAGLAAAAGPPPATQPAFPELRPILAPEARREAARQLIDRFVGHLIASPAFDGPAKKAVADAWKEHRKDQEPQEFLTAGVAIVCEPFKIGLQALDNEDYARAELALTPLVDARDRYVSLHATALLARSLVEQDKLEKAEAVLATLAGKEKELRDKTFLEVEIDFMLGYCQLANLRYDQARATLEQFEWEHPDAPDRFRLAARQMLQELRVRRPESLGEVSDLMVYAGRRLAGGSSGKRVQDSQKHAVELLTKLIQQAQEQEKQARKCKHCGGKGCRRCRGGGGWPGSDGVPTSGAKISALPTGPGRIGELHRSPRARPGEQWGKMRPEQRERILQSLDRNLPSRYRQLIEQYYKQLAKEQ